MYLPFLFYYKCNVTQCVMSFIFKYLRFCLERAYIIFYFAQLKVYNDKIEYLNG